MSLPGDFRFHHRLRVRWSEVDAQQVVFNGHYLNYLDVASGDYWRSLGLPYPDAFKHAGGDIFVRPVQNVVVATAIISITLNPLAFKSIEPLTRHLGQLSVFRGEPEASDIGASSSLDPGGRAIVIGHGPTGLRHLSGPAGRDAQPSAAMMRSISAMEAAVSTWSTACQPAARAASTLASTSSRNSTSWGSTPRRRAVSA